MESCSEAVVAGHQTHRITADLGTHCAVVPRNDRGTVPVRVSSGKLPARQLVLLACTWTRGYIHIIGANCPTYRRCGTICAYCKLVDSPQGSSDAIQRASLDVRKHVTPETPEEAAAGHLWV